MKAVMPSVPPEILEWRRRTGADRWDEMWEGVLHRVPNPSLDHQDFVYLLENYFRTRWALRRGAQVYHNVNVAPVALPGGWKSNYRCPDLVLVLPATTEKKRATLHESHIEGPPDLVIEIRSPDDESYEKLPFYASLGVAEVWIIDRDTKVPEIRVLEESEYRIKPTEDNGWLVSAITGIEMRNVQPGRLSMRIAGDSGTQEELPPQK